MEIQEKKKRLKDYELDLVLFKKERKGNMAKKEKVFFFYSTVWTCTLLSVINVKDVP